MSPASGSQGRVLHTALAGGAGAAGVSSLTHLLVIVPTAQSGRRLRHALARRFPAGLVPPCVKMPAHLVDLSAPDIAGRADELLAWREARDGKGGFDVAAELRKLKESGVKVWWISGCAIPSEVAIEFMMKDGSSVFDRTVIADGDLFLAVQKAFPHRDRPPCPPRRRPVQGPFAAGNRPASGSRREHGARMAEETNQKLTLPTQFLTTLFRPLMNGMGGFGGKGTVLNR